MWTNALIPDPSSPPLRSGFVSPLEGSGFVRAVERKRRFGSRRGLTLVELIVAFTILATLTAMSVPLTKYKIRRERERDLRYALREIRTAIDKYKDMADQNQLGTQKIDTDNYPEKLIVLVEGVKAQGAVDKKIRFLRRLPRDPLTGKPEWGMRSTRDDPKSNSWGGQNVFDVYSKSTEKASDGTPYAEW